MNKGIRPLAWMLTGVLKWREVFVGLMKLEAGNSQTPFEGGIPGLRLQVITDDRCHSHRCEMTCALSHDHFYPACRAEHHRYLACPTRHTLQEHKLAADSGRT